VLRGENRLFTRKGHKYEFIIKYHLQENIPARNNIQKKSLTGPARPQYAVNPQHIEGKGRPLQALVRQYHPLNFLT